MKFAIYSLAVCTVTAVLPLAATAEPRAVSAETKQAAQMLAARFAGDAEPAAPAAQQPAAAPEAAVDASAAEGEASASALMAGLSQTARAAGEHAAQKPDAPTGDTPKPVKRAKRTSPAEPVPAFATTTTPTKRKAQAQAVAASDDPPTIGMRPRDGINDSEPVDITKIFKPSQWFGGDDKKPQQRGVSASFTN